MVVVKVMGGLGNQMFQYALAKELETLGKEVRVDTSFFDKGCEGSTVRKDLYDELEITIPKLSEKERKNVYRDDNSFSSRVIRKACHYLRKEYSFPRIVDDTIEFNPLIYSYDDVILDGYWQSYKYFEKSYEMIKKHFSKLNFDFDIKDLKLLNTIRNRNAIAMHVRGGDYLLAQNSKFSGICTSDYYKKAINSIEGDNPVFVVFSNDFKYAESILELKNMEYIKVDWHTEDDAIKDMYMISQCRQHIIANSSFSWWGAYLSENKKVICPSMWVKADENRDIYVDGWIKI